MDIFQEWFPFIKIPVISNENFIGNSVCSCLTCHPFGRVNHNGLHSTAPKPSQEIKTISSLVDKFTVGRPISDDITQTGSFHLKDTFNRPCNRKRSFNIEMKHERFTSCEPNSYYHHHHHHKNNNNKEETSMYSDYYCGDQLKRRISSEIAITPTMEIMSTKVISADNVTMTTNYEQTNVIVVPPRRKKRTTEKQKQYSESSTHDISLEMNIDMETRKNSRNAELNNLNVPTKPARMTANCYSSLPNVFHKDINFNKNNKINSNTNNNKSGCSSVDVVSGSLEKNILNLNLKNNRNGSAVPIKKYLHGQKGEMVAKKTANLYGYSQNKVYYKDNENCSKCDANDSMGFGGEIDEVLVCESIVIFDQSPPKDSTYTKFCTDSLYRDKNGEDEVSSSSFESLFEHISQLKSETGSGLMSTSPFTRFRIRKQRARHGSLIKDFGLLPSVHRSTEGFYSRTSLTRTPPTNDKNTVCDSKDIKLSVPDLREKRKENNFTTIRQKESKR